MSKPTTILLSLLLSVSILLPAVIAVVEHSVDITLNCDFGDEENKKEEKKEIDEKDIYFHSSSLQFNEKESPKNSALNDCNDGNYSHHLEIQLPPPEPYV